MTQPGDTILTTLHLRQAMDGNPAALDHLVALLNPLLLAQARYRLRGHLRDAYEPQELVNEAWVVALPRIHALQPRDGRWTPVLLKFLASTMNYRIQRLGSARRRNQMQIDWQDQTNPEPVGRSHGVFTKIHHSELSARVQECLDDLDPHDREVIVLRGIEQQPAKAVGQLLGVSSQAIDKRYSRALARIRKLLPQSVFAEIGED